MGEKKSPLGSIDNPVVLTREQTMDMLLRQAIELGGQAAKIEAAIAQLRVACGNEIPAYSMYDAPLFDLLSERREVIRQELLRIDRELKGTL